MTKKYKVIAPNGIHARSATILVNEAVKYESSIEIGIKGNFVDLKSIIGVMSLGIYFGAEIEIKIIGNDSELALANIESLFFDHKLAEEL